MKELEVKGKADNLNQFCCKFPHELFRSAVFNSSCPLKLNNHDLDVLTEMKLECLYSKEILEIWQVVKSTLPFSLLTLNFQVTITPLFDSDWPNIQAGSHFRAQGNGPMSPDGIISTISAGPAGHETMR